MINNSEDYPEAAMPKDFISEAEKIINDYLLSVSPDSAFMNNTLFDKNKIKKKAKKADIFLNGFMICCCAALAVLLYIGLR